MLANSMSNPQGATTGRMIPRGFTIATLNCNGLTNKEKRIELFAHIISSKIDVTFLQETFWDTDLHEQVEGEWKGAVYSSLYNGGRRRGVTCLLRGDADITASNIRTEDSGRFIQLDLAFGSESLTAVGIYAPNIVSDRAGFFEGLNNKLGNTNHPVIITGDFNNVTNTYKDKYPKSPYPDQSRKPLIKLMSKYQLCDIWREKNPERIEFSWTRHRTDGRFASRIDRFLISKTLAHNVINCSFENYPRSDHNLLKLQLDFNHIPRGPGYWIINNSLLKDEDYYNTISELILREKSHSDYNLDFTAWYESLKTKIKQRSIIFSKRKKRAQRKRENLLDKQINYERIKAQKFPDYETSRLKRLEGERDDISREKMRGAAIRSKIQWFEEGERSSKYFLNLEKSRQKKKVMKQLLTDSGHTITDQDSIIKEQLRFYTKLYEDEPIEEEAAEDILSQLSKSLPSEDADTCDEDISAEELKNALFAMESNKSPGSDGITAEFYKTFWHVYIDIFERLIHEILHNNELCNSMKTSTLTLIPKKGDLRRLTNWRPISLLNVDYKIISKSLANRVSNIISKLISDDQTCCIPGRDISHNVLMMCNIIEYANENKLNGYILKVDQFKAFDRVNHDYLHACIKKMGFGPNFRNWIEILYRGSRGQIKHNGFVSHPFPIKRGVRQGCPISAILYVLSAEPLHDVISNSPLISGIHFCDREAKIFQHADDTTFFASSINSIYSILRVLKTYEDASGSKCNFEKTELLTIGESQIDPTRFNITIKNDYIDILGVTIGNDREQSILHNWNDRVQSCISILRRWKSRRLSFRGKALVVNSLVLSRLNYLVSILPVPDWVISSIRKAVTEFIWSGKPPAIKYTSLCLPWERGGINLSDIEICRDSFRIKIIAKLLGGELNTKLHALLLYNLNRYEDMKLGLNIFLLSCEKKSLNRIGSFYREMLSAWNRLTEGNFISPLTREEILFLPIFHNPLIRNRDDETLFNRSFIDGGIVSISDLMYEVIPNPLPALAVHECISMVNPDNPLTVDMVEDYITLIFRALPSDWIEEIYSSDKVVSSQTDYDPDIRFYSGTEVIKAVSLTCHEISKILRYNIREKPTGEVHWTNLFPHLELSKRWGNIYKMPKNFYDADLDFKIMHNILYTNSKLYRFNMADSPLCSLCKTEYETAEHLFLNCSETKSTRDDIVRKLNRIVKMNDANLWGVSILFGLGLNHKNDSGVLADFVLNVFKCVVWNARMAKVISDYRLDIKRFFHNTMKSKLNFLYHVYKNKKEPHKFYSLFGRDNVLLSNNDDDSYIYRFDRG